MFFHRLGPALAEGEVVLVGPALVGVALDEDEDLVALQPLGALVEEGEILRTNRRAGEVEVDNLELGHLDEVLYRRPGHLGLRPLRRRRLGPWCRRRGDGGRGWRPR